jgi:hypothetical protein
MKTGVDMVHVPYRGGRLLAEPIRITLARGRQLYNPAGQQTGDRIGPIVDPQRRTCVSFRVFCSGTEFVVAVQSRALPAFQYFEA